MSNQTYSSVWDAIEDTPEQAQNMKLRSVLMMALKDHITRAGMSQAEAAQHFCVTQPRVSDLMRGKIICSRSMHWSIWRQRRTCVSSLVRQGSIRSGAERTRNHPLPRIISINALSPAGTWRRPG
ncbi:putative XRE-type DNA-binding protein [Paraburkholderia sp. BL23I1N1]|nr:putative XRE-type DNA-binding protein [Paraburkholderia sp. BL23I1N1]